ncbi:MAG: hypothetical protein WCS03_02650 [Bacteroidota bacterium]
MRSEIKISNVDNLQYVIFIVFLLFSIHFWDIRYIPQKLNAENMLTWLACGYCLVMVIQKKNLHFKNAIILFMIGLMINILTAYLNFGQSPKDTILSFEYQYFILLYFMLHLIKPNIKFLENTIIIFAILYSIIYIVQVTIFPYRIVTSGLIFDRGKFQFEILGHGFLMLGYFLILNRFLLDRKPKNILLAIGFFIVLLLMGFRTKIAGALLVTLIMIFRTIRFDMKDLGIIVVVVLLFIGLFQLPGPSNLLKDFSSDTQKNLKEGKNYVRLRQLKFFFNEYPQNVSYYIFGGGKHGGKSIYNFRMKSFEQNYNIVWVDLGILGFYIVIGAVALAGMLWYTFKAIFIKLPNDKQYLNFYFVFLLIVSFTTSEIFSSGVFTVVAIALYLIDMSVNEKSDPDTLTINKKRLLLSNK